MTDAPPPLPPERLYTACDPALFAFETTADLKPFEGIVGQDRASEAVRFGIGMRHDGYNLFALGPEGTGRSTLVRRFLEARAGSQPTPSDWCYVNNFAEPHRPNALALPPGRGRPFRDDMALLVEELRAAVPGAFESDEYRHRKTVIEERFKERHEQVFNEFQSHARARDIALIRTPVGLALAPIKNGSVIKPDDFETLPEDEKSRRQQDLATMQEKLEETLRHLPQWEKELREEIRTLNREVTASQVGYLIEEVQKRWSDQPKVVAYLDAVKSDVVENADDFLPQDQPPAEAMLPPALRRAARGGPSFKRYTVNLVVDHSPDARDAEARQAGAPVVEEDHPTQPNLIGRIEYAAQFGSLVTDFTLIKGGALHRANGGYLVLDALRVLQQPFAWEALKRALQTGRIRIESPAEAMGFATTITLEPEPIPLGVKVVLIGEPTHYYLLNRFDPDFRRLFKVAAEFDDRMDRDPAAARQYAHLIATLAARDGLKPLDRGAVARIVEYGARLADDSEKLSAHIGHVFDLVREADYFAEAAGSAVVGAQHVQQAIDAKVYRSDRIRQRIQEEIHRGTLVIETAGERVGQVNGLSVLQLDSFAFGRPSRITCRIRMGKGEVVDIERAVELGGPLHSKGVMILAAYMGARLSRDRPLTLSASLVFEQSYSGIDGDSASSAELYALLSALSGLPIRQQFAVTGSVDQQGRVQAIGGVNEKIEGFFDVCRARGLTGHQGVLIPEANVKHLMLRADVVAAAREGTFRIHAVSTIDQGIALLTGVPAGTPAADATYPEGTVNRAVADTLAEFATKAQAFAREGMRRMASEDREP